MLSTARHGCVHTLRYAQHGMAACICNVMLCQLGMIACICYAMPKTARLHAYATTGTIAAMGCIMPAMGGIMPAPRQTNITTWVG